MLPARFPAYAALLIVIIACPVRAAIQVVPGCGSLHNAFGPYDYRDPAARGQPLHLVEMAHFTPDVAALLHGSTGALIQDLDYTLRAFPNHHQALQSLSRYALEGDGPFLKGKPPECYFKRAETFTPDDAAVHAIYGDYLLNCVRLKRRIRREILQCGGFVDPEYMDARVIGAAKQQFNDALRLAPSSPDVNYSAALFYLDINEIDKARQFARVAYAGGYPLQGLRKRLEAAQVARKKK